METVNIYRDSEAASRAAAAAFALAVAGAVSERGVAHVALSGGSTPVRTHQLLVDPAEPFRQVIRWEALHVWWGDERNVSPDDPDSNYAMARNTMLDQAPLRDQQVHRIAGEIEPAIAASRYEAELARVFGAKPREVPAFDLICLGIGEDAHTASLFPRTPALDESERLVVANRVDARPTGRITVTFPVLLNARHLLVLAIGRMKADALAAVFRPDADPRIVPAAMLRHTGHRLRWIVDRDAAARMGSA